MQCQAMVSDFLTKYITQRSKLPRLNLQWTVSRRTLTKLKPSTRCILDLEPIMEDEDDPGSRYDAGPFDSENDDSELQRALHKKYYQSLMAMQTPAPTDNSKGQDKCSICPPPPPNTSYDHNQNNQELALISHNVSDNHRHDCHSTQDQQPRHTEIGNDTTVRNPQAM